MDFLSDRIIFFAELNDFAQLAFKLLRPVAQCKDLTLADRYRAAAVRVCYIDLRERFGVLLKKLGMFLQISCDLFGFHRSPSNPAPFSSCKFGSNGESVQLKR